MDIIKIGKFISMLRKERKLTQKELAEHLGVSDKTVSKWERGINLPDASLYYPLCEILDIRINELFAGEKLTDKEILKKSEENIIQTIENNKKVNKVIKIIRIVAICLVPVIILQWNLKIIWVKVEMNMGFGAPPIAEFYAKLYLISLLYFIAYFLVYKKVKLGYYLMWVIYIVLSFLYLMLTRTNSEYLFMFTSLDLWINIVLTILGIITKELNLSLLFKRSS